MSTWSRRNFLVHTSTTLLALGGGATLLGACGGKKKKASLQCNDTSGLDPAAVQTRRSLAYVDASPHAEKNCLNCRFYQNKGESQCGGCTLIQGPIHPQGYCKSWAAQAA